MTGRRSPLATERGVALLSALFTVALLTIVVLEMTDATLVHTHLTRNAGNAMAAQLLARSAALAGEALVSNDDTNPPGVTCRQNPWALPLFGIPAGSGTVGLQVSDEAGKLDLNSVRDERYRKAAQSLFSTLELDPSLVDRIATWITPAGDPAMATGGGSDYCALDMSCTPRQQPLQSLEELLLIRGFDERTLVRLRPYATAVPRPDGKAGQPQSLNPLTAEPIVLAAIGCESGSPPPDCPSSFANDEAKKEWQKEFDEWKASSCTADAQRMLKTQSNLYAIFASGTVGDVTQRLRTTVQRSGDRVDRLWWQESRLTEGAPVEVR